MANRLPTTVSVAGDKITYTPSSGGLATGLDSFIKSHGNKESLWIGWPGVTIADNQKEIVSKELHKNYKSIPVFFSEEEMDKFYHGFCNKTIWPLFHYFPTYTEFSAENWQQYKEINELFCAKVLEYAKPNDTIWIHDYQLMLVPRLLREKLPNARIGFFLHIPFPFYEIFRLLPKLWREEILQGLLGSDLIGFHTHNYVQYFLSCALRILGVDHTTGKINYDDRVIHVDSFPMGIDFDKFFVQAKSEVNAKEVLGIKQNLNNLKMILSLDRLDYTKGIYKRLLGYEQFLQDHPEWQGKVVLMIILVPSRVGVDSYQQMKKQLDEEIGRINGKYTALGWTPIIYQFKSIPFNSLVALYNTADVALVTPLRDGMNLVAKEYIASQPTQHGVLILSEMAGAAQELTEALIINPNNPEEIAQAIHVALEMPQDEQMRRNKFLQQRIQRYDVRRWAQDFMTTLAAPLLSAEIPTLYIDEHRKTTIINAFKKREQRVIFLDYDGTLVPFSSDPKLAKPNAELLGLLRKLAQLPHTDVVLISGRDRETMAQWFESLPVTLVAEHGVWIKQQNNRWRLIRSLSAQWKASVLPILEKYTDRIPGSLIENKDYSLSWHYRMADQDQCLARKQELIDDLVHFTANVDVTVVQGNKVVEVRNTAINKGVAVHDILAGKHYGFILCIGDDTTDEDMFKALPKNGISVKVGPKDTAAKYYVKDQREVLNLLKRIMSI